MRALIIIFMLVSFNDEMWRMNKQQRDLRLAEDSQFIIEQNDKRHGGR